MYPQFVGSPPTFAQTAPPKGAVSWSMNPNLWRSSAPNLASQVRLGRCTMSGCDSSVTVVTVDECHCKSASGARVAVANRWGCVDPHPFL